MLDLWSEKLLATPYYTFTINPTPSNATVTINGVNTKTVTVEDGTTISWSVSASGYVSQSGSLTLTDDTTKTVTLVQNFTFTINPTPSNATVTINGATRKTITAAKGTAITWSVSASGYVTQSGSLTLTANTTKNITLVSSLKYACYKINTNYWYAKAPLGSDMSRYYNSAGTTKPATTASQLKVDTAVPWKSVTESKAVFEIYYNGQLLSTSTLSRYKAGDLYS